jgi:hypothetical protein
VGAAKCVALFAILAGAAAAQESQQRYVPAPATQYDEADELALREYVDVRIDSLDRSVQTALTSAKEAVLKAEAATNDRFSAVNEFRGSLNDVARVQMPRTEAEQVNRALSERIDRLTTQVNDMASRSQGVSAMWPFLVGGAGIIFGVFGVFMALRRGEAR